MRPRSLLSQATPLLVGRGFSAALSFALPLVLARRLDATGYGTYKQIFLISNTAFYLLQLGMAQSLYYFVPRSEDTETRRTFVAQTYLFLAVAGAVAAVAMVFLAGPFARAMSNPELVPLAPLTALMTWLLIATAALEIQLTAEGRLVAAGLAYGVLDAVRVSFALVPILFGAGLSGFLWGSIAALAIRAAIGVGLVWRGSWPQLSWQRFRDQLGYALPFGAAMLLSIPQQQFHQYAVGWSVDPATFALYTVGCFQIPIVNLLYSPVSDVLQVRLAKLAISDSRGALALLHEAVDWLAFFFLPLSIGLVASAPELIPALFTDRYAAAVPLFRLAVLAVPLAALPLDGVLRARGNTRYLFRFYFAKLAITVPAVLLGIRVGLLGAIAATTTVEVFTRIMMLARVRHDLNLTWRELLPWRKLTTLTGWSALCIGAVWSVRMLPSMSAMRSALLECGAYGALYLGGYGAFGLLRRREIFRPATAS